MVEPTPPAYGTFADWLRTGPYRACVVEHRAAGVTPASLAWTAQAESFPDPATPDFVLNLYTAGAARDGRYDFGAGRFALDAGPGTMLLAPPGVACDYQGRGPFQALCLGVPAGAVRRLLEGADLPGGPPADFGRLHAETFRDELVERISMGLWEEAADSGPLGGLFADAALNALVLRLVRLAGRAVPAPGPRERLAPAALRRCLDLLHAGVEGGVSLAELTAAADHSPFHFVRLFKASTGEPPHRYLTRLRVERAKELLRTHPHLTVAAVAARCGFCDQSHLARHFKRLTGTTPAAFRAAGG